MSPCGVVLYDHPAGWTLRRNPKCNRPHGHKGPHREYDRRTAAVRAEWWTAIAGGLKAGAGTPDKSKRRGP